MIDRNKREIIWKRRNQIEIKWYVVLFGLREYMRINILCQRKLIFGSNFFFGKTLIFFFAKKINFTTTVKREICKFNIQNCTN